MRKEKASPSTGAALELVQVEETAAIAQSELVLAGGIYEENKYDPYYDHEDIELLNEDLVTVDVATEPRVSKLVTELYVHSGEGHEIIAATKAKGSVQTQKLKARKCETCAWYSYTVGWGVVSVVALTFFIPMLLRMLAVAFACPYRGIPKAGTIVGCPYFRMPPHYKEKQFQSFCSLRRGVSASAFNSFLPSLVEEFMRTENTSAFLVQHLPNVSSDNKSFFNSSLGSTLCPDYDVRSVDMISGNWTNIIRNSTSPHDDVKHCTACIRPTLEWNKWENDTTWTVEERPNQSTGCLYSDSTLELMPWYENELNETLRSLIKLRDGFRYVEYDGHFNASTSCVVNETHRDKPWLQWQNYPLLPPTITGLRERLTAFFTKHDRPRLAQVDFFVENFYAGPENLYNQLASEYGQQWVGYAPPHCQSPVYSERDPSIIVSICTAARTRTEPVDVVDSDFERNVVCSQSTKKENGTYAMTVPMNVTINSTVYDVEEHTAHTIDFMVYNNSHPCIDIVDCTFDSIWSFANAANRSSDRNLTNRASPLVAWIDQNLSYPFTLNLKGVTVKFKVSSSNIALLREENIGLVQEEFGVFKMTVRPEKWRYGSTTITVRIVDIDSRRNFTATQCNHSATSTCQEDRNNTVLPASNVAFTNPYNATKNFSGARADNTRNTVDPTFDIERFRGDMLNATFAFTVRVNKTVCGHHIDFFLWKMRAVDFPQHVYFIGFLAQLLLTLLFGAMGDYCCLRRLGLFVFSSLGSLCLLTFYLWTAPKDYLYAGLATVLALSCFGMASVYHNAFMARLVQAESKMNKRLLNIEYSADMIPFNETYDVMVDQTSNYSFRLFYCFGCAGLVASYMYVLWAQHISFLWEDSVSFVHFLFAIGLQANRLILVEPSVRNITFVIAACGSWMSMFALTSSAFIRTRWGFPCRKMSLMANILPPVSWAFYSVYKHGQMFAEKEERVHLVHAWTALGLFFVIFLAIDALTFTNYVHVNSELATSSHSDNSYKATSEFFRTILLATILAASSWFGLKVMNKFQTKVFLLHIDMVMLCTGLFQSLMLYALFVNASGLVFGLKSVEEVYGLTFFQGFFSGPLMAYCRTAFLHVIPAGFESQFFSLYQNSFGVGYSWLGAKMADAVFRDTGSVRLMYVWIFLLVLFANLIFCCSIFSLKEGKSAARKLRRIIRARKLPKVWTHLKTQVANRRESQVVSEWQLPDLIHCVHTQVNINDAVDAFSALHPKVHRAQIFKTIRNISKREIRAPTPFYLFQKNKRPRVEPKFRFCTRIEITQRIHTLWENCTDEVRAEYEEKAEQEKDRDRLRYFIKDEVLWNVRYTRDLKKLKDFEWPSIEIQKIARGFLVRNRTKLMETPIRSSPERQRCTLS
jgi:MFS-type transporter involved in bile tolerance (Atg22 family)